MSVWFTSDLHIGHVKVAEQRVPTGVQEHDAILATMWDLRVGRDDVVWVLGDISSGTKSGQLNALEWLRQRPGHKHLIAGNHDSVHPLHRDSHKWLPLYLDGTFESVQLAAKRRIPLVQGHVTAMLSHFPYTGDHQAVDRYPEWRLPDCGHYVLHGHTHSTYPLSIGGPQWRYPMRINQIHVGVDTWGFRPVHLDEIVELVQTCEENPL
ncbi:MAG: metallophosphoesterase family protein [Mycobacterium sp.]